MNPTYSKKQLTGIIRLKAASGLFSKRKWFLDSLSLAYSKPSSTSQSIPGARMPLKNDPQYLYRHQTHEPDMKRPCGGPCQHARYVLQGLGSLDVVLRLWFVKIDAELLCVGTVTREPDTTAGGSLLSEVQNTFKRVSVCVSYVPRIFSINASSSFLSI